MVYIHVSYATKSRSLREPSASNERGLRPLYYRERTWQKGL